MTPYISNSVASLRPLSADEFVDIITLANEKDYADFYGPYDSFKRAIIIKDTVVNDKVVLTNKLTIDLPLIIIGGHFNSYQIDGCNFKDLFRIEDCTFHDEFHITNAFFQDLIQIEDCNFKRYFLIKDGDFSKKCLIIRNKFEGYFNIKGGDYQADFWIDRAYFEHDFTIEGGTFYKNFTIVDTTFNIRFSVLYGNFYGSFKLTHNVFQEDILVQSRPIFHREFWLEGGTIKGIINYKDGYINHLILSKLTSKVEVEIFEKISINQLTFRAVIQKDSYIALTGGFHLIEFDSIHNLGLIKLNNVCAKSSPSKFEKNLSSNTLANVSGRPQFRIINSDLGKMILINSKLEDYDLDFMNSRITDLFIVGTKMPQMVISSFGSEEIFHEQQQQFYSQIKKTFEASGDKVLASQYLAKELDAYKNKIKKSKDKGEYIILWLNEKTSYYGQNWLLALKWTLYCSISLYFAYCVFLGFLPCISSWKNIETFGRLVSYYPEFLNPIHKADYIADELVSPKSNTNGLGLGVARVVEAISRIIIGFLIYQLVQAFRKHGKSGN